MDRAAAGGRGRDEGRQPMSAAASGYGAPDLRASDADRDAVVTALSQHYQAGRLTTEELEERTGRALTARTLGELGDLTADLPGPRIAEPPRPAPPMAPPAWHGWLGYRAAVPLAAVIAAVVIAALAVGAGVGHHNWLVLLVPALIVARASRLRRGSSRRSRW